MNLYPLRVNVLSDESESEDAGHGRPPPSDCYVDSDSDGAPEAKDKSTLLEDLRAALNGSCGCMRKRAKRARTEGSRTSVIGKTCFECFREPVLWEQTCDQRLAWARLHKLDQDRMLFDELKIERVKVAACSCPERTIHRQFKFNGVPVCLRAFLTLRGIGYCRFIKIDRAVAAGALAPPLDMRYRKKTFECAGQKRAYITSYFDELYESEAESLPECLDDCTVSVWDDVVLCSDASVTLTNGMQAFSSDTKFLPPGTLFEYWKLYNHLFPEYTCGFQYFWGVFKADWTHKLHFRHISQHAACPTCVKHKLIIRELGGDAIRRDKQLALFQQHKHDQYRDRRVYWNLRAQAWLHFYIIVIILDGMDQAKFAYPRAGFLKSKDFDSLQRPRLHVEGVIVHGHFVHVSVSNADFPTDANVTIELVAYALTQVSSKGIRLDHAHVHVQMDNTCSNNKNNYVMRFLASMVCCCIFDKGSANFLRKGHTHEDIDQFFGRLASWIALHTTIETPEQFIVVIQNFLDKLPLARPWPVSRRAREAFLLDTVRDWKSWLADTGMTLKGHTGPRAPHSFTYARRSAVPEDVVEHAFDKRVRHNDDVILLCKSYMASISYSQKPIVVMTKHGVLNLASAPEAASALRPMTKTYKDHILSYVPKLRAAPYRLLKAAESLEQWVTGTLSHGPPLNTSACHLNLRVVSGDIPIAPVSYDIEPAAFEPSTGMVSLSLARDAVAAGPPSVKALIVYGCAESLVSGQGLEWSAAIALGEQCWRSTQATRAGKAALQPLLSRGRGARGGRGRGHGRAGRGHVIAVPAVPIPVAPIHAVLIGEDEVSGDDAGVLDVLGLDDR